MDTDSIVCIGDIVEISLAPELINGMVTTWDMNTGAWDGIGRHETDDVNTVAWSPDGQSLASADDAGIVLLWSLEK